MNKYLNFIVLFFVTSLTMCFSQDYILIEAEAFDSASGDYAVASDSGASGGQYVDAFKGNATLNYTFNATAGTYTFVMSAANPNRDDSSMTITVNETPTNLPITRTYSWGVYSGSIIENVTLIEGANTLSVDQNTSLSSEPDKIEFFPDDLVYSGGTWTPNAPDATTGANNVMVKDGTFTTSGDININSIVVSSGASVEVRPSDVLTVNSSLYNAGTFTFQSDATGSAQFLIGPSCFTTPSDITVERYIPAQRAFRLLSAAVTGQTIENAWQQNTHITGTGGATNGFDETTTNNPSMYTFDNSLVDQSGGAAWTAVDNTNVRILSAGEPYRLYVRGDRSIDLTNNSAPATATTLSSTGVMVINAYLNNIANEPGLNYAFIGNPYQAVVDISLVHLNNISSIFYVWDVNQGTNGGFVTINRTNGVPDPSSSDANQYLNPGQGFFVRRGNNTFAKYVRFEEADKAPTQTENDVFKTNTMFYINSRLYKTADLQKGEMESDAIGLRFSEDFTTFGDDDEDSGKMINPGENYAIINNGIRAIDKQGLPEDGHEVSLAVANYEVSDYSLTFAMENKPEDLEVFLNDNYLNTKTKLSNDTVYDFTVDTSIAESKDENRFKLVFEKTTLSNESFTDADVRLYPNPVKNRLSIDLPATAELESVKLYNMLGQEMKSVQSTSVEVSDLSSGIYLVEIHTKQGQITKKIIKQ